MDLISRLEGYTNNQIVYNNPIPTIPAPKTLHDKKDTTLLQMAMKSFLKQRLYGNLSNFKTSNDHNKNHLIQRERALTSRNKLVSSLQKSSEGQSQNQSFYYKNSNSALQNQHQESSKSNVFKQTLYKKRPIQIVQNFQKRRLSQVGSSLDIKNSNLKLYQRQNIREKVKNQGSLVLKLRYQQNLRQNQQYIEDSSFISQIGTRYQRQKIKIYEASRQEGLKLPQIQMKTNKKNGKQDMIKIKKSVLKKQIDNYLVVSDEFWRLIAKSTVQKRIRLKEKKEVNNELANLENNSQLNSQMHKIEKIYQKDGVNESLNNENKSLINTKNNQTLCLNRQIYQTIMSNQKFTIPLFITNIINFFEVSHRIQDKIRKYELQSILLNLFNMKDRIWCITIFRFLDWNHDGKIDSSDLFKIHNYLEQLKNKIENYKNDASSIKDSTKNSISQFSAEIVKKQFKSSLQSRQKTQNSQLTYFSTFENQQEQGKKKRKGSFSTNSIEKQMLDEQSSLISQNLILKNLQNVKKFQNQIRKLNNLILCKDKSLRISDNSPNPQRRFDKSSYTQQKVHLQLKYLEEALLKNQDLKISDLNLILSQPSTNNQKGKKKVIDIDFKSLNIKLSSSYVQTFAATDHNQQTRINRQYIQTLKDYLKKQNDEQISLSNVLEKKTLPDIKYTEFLEQNLFKSFKNLFFSLIQSQTTQFK